MTAEMPPEHVVYEVPVGSLVWTGYQVRCGECGATGGWSLRVQQPPWAVGERAWALCPLGHSVHHPLVYPEMVHTLIRWSAGDRDAATVAELMADLDWRPHRTMWLGGGDSADDTHIVLQYPWEDPRAGGPYYWRTAWPALWQIWDPDPPAQV